MSSCAPFAIPPSCGWTTAAEPSSRFKMFEARYKRIYQLALRVSPDGQHWSEELAVSGPSWDRSTAFYNPFRKVWVASVRGHDRMLPDPVHRIRNYHEGRTRRKP